MCVFVCVYVSVCVCILCVYLRKIWNSAHNVPKWTNFQKSSYLNMRFLVYLLVLEYMHYVLSLCVMCRQFLLDFINSKNTHTHTHTHTHIYTLSKGVVALFLEVTSMSECLSVTEERQFRGKQGESNEWKREKGMIWGRGGLKQFWSVFCSKKGRQ